MTHKKTLILLILIGVAIASFVFFQKQPEETPICFCVNEDDCEKYRDENCVWGHGNEICCKPWTK